MPVQFKHHTLDNGLTIVAETNPDAHTAAVGFFVHTGTRDEPEPLMGVSHFLEHMMFKGTARRTADDVNRDFDRIGANYNASTSQELTTYYAHLLPEHLHEAIDVLSDILRPSLRAEDFDMEKNVILEEIGMYQDRPFWVGYERAMELFYDAHPLAYRILGTSDSIKALKRDQMADYFNHHYSPDNIVVSLSGALDFDRCVKQIADACGAWKPTGVKRAYDPARHKADQFDIASPQINRHYVIVLCPAPSRQDERRYAAAILSNLIGDADGSFLYWSLIEPGLADEADFSPQPFDRDGSYLAYASCDPDRGQKVEAILLNVLDTAAEKLTDQDVERAKSKIAMDITLQGERPAGRMMSLGATWLDLREYRSLDEELNRIMAVTPNDLRQLIADYPFNPRTIVRLKPGK